jgi:ceramide glucosyltransferase
MIHDILLLTLWAAGAFGCLYMIVAAALIFSSARPTPAASITGPSVTILKPLHGDEVGLFENLSSFCEQDYTGEVQIVFGVENPNDLAIAVVERLRAAYPNRAIELVVDTRVMGSNPKIANLLNMSGRIAHDIVVLADSDIRVRRDYLSHLVRGLDRFGGAVTCPYYGISIGNLWSRLAQLTIDSHFLPGVVVGARLKLSQPCLGSTIALRRQSLMAIGGFEPLADCLADDYVLGEMLQKRGEPVSLLSYAVGHMCSESSFIELWRHELRWALTIRTIDPLGYLGWAITHAFPLALIAWAMGGGWPAIWLGLAALACRAVLIFATERGYDLPRHPYWLIPVRDLLSFAIFVAGFVARDVSWRGHHYELMSEGILKSDRRSPSS